jgi:hypothetical protein
MDDTGEATAAWLAKAAEEIAAACVKRGWRMDWSARGAYLFLEAAEFVESLRGKGDSPPAEEAADVLLVFLSMIGAFKIDTAEVLEQLRMKLTLIKDGKIGAKGGA